MKANEIYPLIADNLIEQLKKGVIPWKQPWGQGNNICYNAATGHAYSVINCLLLGAAGGYITFKQALQLDGKVKKGAKAKKIFQPIPYKKNTEPEQETDEEQEETRVYYIYKLLHVFSLADCEGINPEKIQTPEGTQRDESEATPDELDAILNADLFKDLYLAKENIRLLTGDSAAYSIPTDEIILPDINRFISAEEYYSTFFHEAIHSTGSKTRLNRIKEKETSKDYAIEEITAELGCAFVIGTLGIKLESVITNQAAYIADWIKRIDENPEYIYKAAIKAAKAADYILNCF